MLPLWFIGLVYPLFCLSLSEVEICLSPCYQACSVLFSIVITSPGEVYAYRAFVRLSCMRYVLTLCLPLGVGGGLAADCDLCLFIIDLL